MCRLAGVRRGACGTGPRVALSSPLRSLPSVADAGTTGCSTRIVYDADRPDRRHPTIDTLPRDVDGPPEPQCTRVGGPLAA